MNEGATRRAGMFTILASPRSGTTLLACALDQHDSILTTYQADVVFPLVLMHQRLPEASVGKDLIARFLCAMESFDRTLGRYLTGSEVREAILESDYTPGSMLVHLYRRMAQKAHKAIAGDKTPNDLGRIGLLQESGILDADIKVIHLVRDVRDVISSLAKVRWAPGDFGTSFPRLWSETNVALHDHLGANTEKYLLIWYEDLVSDPRRSLERVAGFLGLEFQTQMLDHVPRPHSLREMLFALPDHANLREPISTSRVGRWRRELRPAVRRAIEAQAREGLARFGYAPQSVWLRVRRVAETWGR